MEEFREKVEFWNASCPELCMVLTVLSKKVLKSPKIQFLKEFKRKFCKHFVVFFVKSNLNFEN